MYFKSFFDNLGTQNPLKTARKRQNCCTKEIIRYRKNTTVLTEMTKVEKTEKNFKKIQKKC